VNAEPLEPFRRIARYGLALPVLPPLQQHQAAIVREMFPHASERTANAGEVARESCVASAESHSP